jgi:hypothetical protein
MRPEISVPYLEKAIRLASVVGAPVVNTDEGIRPPWLDDEECFQVMRYTLKKVLQVAGRYGIHVGIEPHQSLTKTTAGLLRIATLVDSPFRESTTTRETRFGRRGPVPGPEDGAAPAGPYPRKDISIRQAENEQGKVWHPGRLRVRRGRDRLGAGDLDPAGGELGGCSRWSVRHAQAGGRQPGASGGLLNTQEWQSRLRGVEDQLNRSAAARDGKRRVGFVG